jgi:hypothetical protein
MRTLDIYVYQGGTTSPELRQTILIRHAGSTLPALLPFEKLPFGTLPFGMLPRSGMPDQEF